MALKTATPDRGKRIEKLEVEGVIYLEVIGATNLLVSTTEIGVNAQLLGQRSGLHITSAMGFRELMWKGDLWVRADDVPGSGNDALYNIEVPRL